MTSSPMAKLTRIQPPNTDGKHSSSIKTRSSSHKVILYRVNNLHFCNYVFWLLHLLLASIISKFLIDCYDILRNMTLKRVHCCWFGRKNCLVVEKFEPLAPPKKWGPTAPLLVRHVSVEMSRLMKNFLEPRKENKLVAQVTG